MVSVDPEGMDLRCGDTLHRLVFDEPVTDANACHKALVSMASKARAAK
jgi:putative heme iron utilization protein